ncbi:hypothetical protein [Actinacidiphila glaucinigra]
MEDALPKEVEAGSAEHLALNHLDLVVVTFDVTQGQKGPQAENIVRS